MTYKLRQEKDGGYLLDSLRGQSIRLSQSAYDSLLELHRIGHIPENWQNSGMMRHFGEKRADAETWWKCLEQIGLTGRLALGELQIFTMGDGGVRLPHDCLAAPARIYFELTRRCNLKCHTCFNDSHERIDDELSTFEIKDALQQLHNMGTFEIRFTGGEPTCHPDFQGIVSYAKSLGFYVSTGTNGVYSSRVREWVYDSGIDWFIISLDGDESTNDLIRGRGVYKHVKQTLHNLSSSGVRVRLNMVVARHNVHVIEAVARLADDYGVESLNLIPLRPYGRSADTMVSHMFNQYDFYAFIKIIQALRNQFSVQFVTTLDLLDPEATTSHDSIVHKKQTCAAGVEAAVIGATGDFYGCSYSPASSSSGSGRAGRRMFVAGNIRQDAIATIWRDSSRWRVFRKLDEFKNSKCHSCQHYSVRCVGSCPIMGYFQEGRPEAMDPYCFADLIT